MRFQDNPTESAMKNINIAALGQGADIQQVASFNTFGTTMQLQGGILRIPTPTFRKFFQPSLNSITKHVKELLANDACKSLKHIFLVGGYAESPVLLHAIKVHKSLPPPPSLFPPRHPLSKFIWNNVSSHNCLYRGAFATMWKSFAHLALDQQL